MMPSDQMIVAGIAAVLLSLIGSAAAIRFGRAWGFVAGPRQLPAIGGLAVISAWWAVVSFFHAFDPFTFVGFFSATLMIVLVGLVDVRWPLGPLPQFLAHCGTAAAAVLLGGIAVRYVTNPFGGLVYLGAWEIAGIAVSGALLTMLWIVTLMNVVNFLDGVDGLAASVSAVAFVSIAFVSLLPQVNDKHTALLAFTAAGALVGYLFWNLPPAMLYLGTVGSWFLGFLLAVLAVQGASKVATLAVVGAVPLIDAGAVIVGRLRRGQSPFRGDRTHLHHRLERRGLSPRSILLLYLLISIVLGIAAVVLQTRFKVLVFLGVSAIFVLLVFVGSRVVRRKRPLGDN